ncbi:MAG: crossover junction endodeoxyribonuclease RuvC [Limisphaerales bacterium]
MGISPQDFRRMQGRLGKGCAVERDPVPAAPTYRRILGIDPSLRGTGYGIVERQGGLQRFVQAGTIRCPASLSKSRCLAMIASRIRALIASHIPEVCVVEGLFFAQNLKTAITMGEARGAALAMVAEAGLEIFELSPRAAKLAIVGFGGAQKLAVAKMVQRILCLEEPPEPDAADALALALALSQGGSGFASRRMKPL